MKKTRFYKACVSLLLAVCMILGMVTPAFAASYAGDDVYVGLSDIQPEDTLTLPVNTEWATLTARWGVRLIFRDWDDTELKSEVIPVTDDTPGSSEAPEDPTRDEWVFLGWERIDENGDENVTLNDDGEVTDITGPGPIIYKAVYSPTFKVVHSSDLSVDVIPLYTLDDTDGQFDITVPLSGDGYDHTDFYNGIHEGYIYGGMASDDDFVTPVTDENGKSLTPQGGETYYLREVSDEYLQPALINIRRQDTDTNVEHYLVTALDKNGTDYGFYKWYGFVYNFDEARIGDIGNKKGSTHTGETEEIYDASQGSEEYPNMSCLLYEQIDVYDRDVFTTTWRPYQTFICLPFERVEGKPYVSAGDYFGCTPVEAAFRVSGGMHDSFAYQFCYTPYYITADGVLVTGIKERFTNDSNSAADTCAVSQDAVIGSHTYVSAESMPASVSAMSLRVMKTMAARPIEEEPEETVTTINARPINAKRVIPHFTVRTFTMLEDRAPAVRMPLILKNQFRAIVYYQ